MTGKLIEGSIIRVLLGGVLLFCAAFSTAAQAQTGGIHGTVVDPSGAVVPSATITLSSQGGSLSILQSGGDGAFAINHLKPGTYSISVSAQGFAPFSPLQVHVIAGQNTLQNISLQMPIATQQVTVSDETTTVNTSAANNSNALVIKGKDLDALSDDPDELQNELTALAGPAAGPNGGQIYIDGFTGGQLPPKSSIREIRINSNPLSAQYDKLGYGRIQILTKPGTDKFHGMFMIDGNDSTFNSLNSFVTSEPPYYSTFLTGYASGALSKASSWFGSVFRRDDQSNSIVNADLLDSSGNVYNYTAAVSSPQSHLSVSPRFDFQLGSNNTLTARYSLDRTIATNSGIGQFALQSQGYNSSSYVQTLQLSDTQILSGSVVNDSNFEYVRSRSNQFAQNNAPTVMVQGAFTGGGNSMGTERNNQDHYELENNTMVSKGAHDINFGERLRFSRDSNYTTSGANGTYIYSSLSSYLANTPAQYTVTAGTGISKLDYFDAALYYQNDYKARPNLTLSYGLRFESQNRIRDHADWAPRLSLAWAPGGHGTAQAKTVIRGGYGWFYDRFTDSNILQSVLENGINQRQYVVNAPSFYQNAPTPSQLSASNSAAPTTYSIAPNLRSAINMQAAVGVDRQLSKFATVSATYINSRGVHQYMSDNVNAYIPSTYNPLTGTGTRPNGINENIYQFESGGVYSQNQLMVNYSVNAKRVSLFGFYTFGYAKADTAGASYFPSDQADPGADYGRASFDVRNRFLLGGSFLAPYGIAFSPMMVVNSGQPFNITIGTDNGDNQFNERPAYATASSTDTVQTSYGTFDLDPAWNQTRIPYDYGNGPGQFSLNFRLSKSIGIGPKATGSSGSPGGAGGPGGGGPPPGGGRGGPGGGLGPGGLSGRAGGPPRLDQAVSRRYTLNFAAMGRNILNNVNLAAPVGVLESPLFDKSTALAGGFFSSPASNRSIDLQVSFSF